MTKVQGDSYDLYSYSTNLLPTATNPTATSPLLARAPPSSLLFSGCLRRFAVLFWASSNHTKCSKTTPPRFCRANKGKHWRSKRRRHGERPKREQQRKQPRRKLPLHACRVCAGCRYEKVEMAASRPSILELTHMFSFSIVRLLL